MKGMLYLVTAIVLVVVGCFLVDMLPPMGQRMPSLKSPVGLWVSQDGITIFDHTNSVTFAIDDIYFTDGLVMEDINGALVFAHKKGDQQ